MYLTAMSRPAALHPIEQMYLTKKCAVLGAYIQEVVSLMYLLSALAHDLAVLKRNFLGAWPRIPIIHQRNLDIFPITSAQKSSGGSPCSKAGVLLDKRPAFTKVDQAPPSS